MKPIRTVRPVGSIGAALMLCVACQPNRPTQPPPPAPPQPSVRVNGFDPNASSANTDNLVNDPAANRLHDIGGYILEYYAEHRQLPDDLHELQAYAEEEHQKLDLKEPGSDKEFVYVPQGLALQGQAMQIIVYAPDLSKDGKRLCLLMSPPQPGAPLNVDVFSMPQLAFQQYLPPQ